MERGRGKFITVGAFPKNKNWELLIENKQHLYDRNNDIRSEFARDYNRILHCTAYRRLKHKTQVFFATGNDHICTRIEHVNHVASVSNAIASYLGLNTELTNAIATGHDLGHAPFGHQGESVLKEIMDDQLEDTFWHEKNSLRFIDLLETLQDPLGQHINLNLTYAVRDGIVMHCGEVDQVSPIFPRQEYMDLEEIVKASQYSPFTWEGCVVKIADKIAYLGRDIEDALTLKILSGSQLDQLKSLIREEINKQEVNTTVLMHELIINLCSFSSPKEGIWFSSDYLDFIDKIKIFNYENIYKHPRLDYFKQYANLIIKSIFEQLLSVYEGKETLKNLQNGHYQLLSETFSDWLIKYSNADISGRASQKYCNYFVYNIDNESDYKRAIIDFISGMTDNFAIKIFEELTRF